MSLARSLAGRRTTVVAVATIVLGCCAVAPALAGGSSASGLTNAGNAWEGSDHGDGLNRFVVELAADTQATLKTAGATNSAAQAGNPAGTPGSTASTQHLDLALLAQARATLGGGGQLDVDSQGRTTYVAGGRSMLVGASAVQTPAGPAQPAANPATAPDTADAQLAALQHEPGVVSAQRLHDGSVLLATSLSKADVAKLPNIVSATASESVPVADAVAVPNDPFFNYDWHLHNTGWASGQSATAGDDVDALDAWSVTKGAGVVVADLDTGFDTSHPDLAGTLWSNPNEACGSTDTDGDGYAGDCHGWNFYRGSADLDNGGDDAHGTMTAGAIAAQVNNGLGVAGLAPDAKLMVLVVGAGENVDMAAATQAIYYAVDHGANVINCSFGGALSGPPLAALQAAVDYAAAHGVMLAVSAANDSGNRDVSPVYPANISSPALLSVGSTDANDHPSSFSGYGKKTVALFAPGSLIAVTNNQGGYSLASGTSFSAPLVAATLALEKSADPSATVTELRARLLNSTTPVAALTQLAASGGRLNAGGAVGSGPGVLHYRFGGFASAQPGVAFDAHVTVTGAAPAGPYELKLQLLTNYENKTWAVSQTPITLGSASATTDDDGAVTFSIDGTGFADGAQFQPGLTLPEGTYALVAQVIADGTPIGRPTAAVFDVAAPGSDNGAVPGK